MVNKNFVVFTFVLKLLYKLVHKYQVSALSKAKMFALIDTVYKIFLLYVTILQICNTAINIYYVCALSIAKT